MFNSGVITSTSKIGPAQMREELRRRYPGKFSIPSQQELRSKVSTLFMASKAIGGQPVPIPDETHVRKPRRGRKSTLPDAVSSFLLGAVKQIPTLKPQHGLEQVRAKFPDLPTLVTDKQIKAKVSAIKRPTSKNLARDCEQVPQCATPVKFQEIAIAFRGIFGTPTCANKLLFDVPPP